MYVHVNIDMCVFTERERARERDTLRNIGHLPNPGKLQVPTEAGAFVPSRILPLSRSRSLWRTGPSSRASCHDAPEPV